MEALLAAGLVFHPSVLPSLELLHISVLNALPLHPFLLPCRFKQEPKAVPDPPGLPKLQEGLAAAREWREKAQVCWGHCTCCVPAPLLDGCGLCIAAQVPMLRRLPSTVPFSSCALLPRLL